MKWFSSQWKEIYWIESNHRIGLTGNLTNRIKKKSWPVHFKNIREKKKEVKKNSASLIICVNIFYCLLPSDLFDFFFFSNKDWNRSDYEVTKSVLVTDKFKMADCS